MKFKYKPNRDKRAITLCKDMRERIAGYKAVYEPMPLVINESGLLDYDIDPRPTPKMEANDFLNLLRGNAWDRPSAFWELLSQMPKDSPHLNLAATKRHLEIDEGMEVSMYDLTLDVGRSVGISTQEIEERHAYCIRELRFLADLFRGNIPEALLDKSWDT